MALKDLFPISDSNFFPLAMLTQRLSAMITHPHEENYSKTVNWFILRKFGKLF